jgi:hypothetical protein
MWPWVYDAIGDKTVLCHIIKSYRTHRVEIPRNRLPFYMVSCCDILQKTSDFSPENYEMIGKSTLEETARRTGPISEPMIDHSDTATAVTICNSAARGFEVLVENSERHLIALQEAQSSTGVVVGSMAEAWNRFGSAVNFVHCYCASQSKPAICNTLPPTPFEKSCWHCRPAATKNNGVGRILCSPMINSHRHHHLLGSSVNKLCFRQATVDRIKRVSRC